MGFFDKFSWFYHFSTKIFGRHKKYLSLIESHVDLDNKMMVDVGGGSGIMAELLLKYTNYVTVVDPSRNMLSLIKNSKIVKKIGRADKLPLLNKSVDVIIMTDAFHHVTNGGGSLPGSVKEFNRVLKKNGTIVLVEFNPLSFVGKVIVWVEKYIIKENSTFFSKKELAKLFRDYKVKFTDVNSHTYLAVIKR